MVNEINPISPRQGNLQLFPVKEVEIEGVAMGVLNDGHRISLVEDWLKCVVCIIA